MTLKGMYVRLDENGYPIDPVPTGWAQTNWVGAQRPVVPNGGGTFESYYGMPMDQAVDLVRQGRSPAGAVQIDPLAQVQEWDYQNPPIVNGKPVNQRGEALPWNAEGFTPDGRGYYGQGLQGWVRGIYSRMYAPQVDDLTQTENFIKDTFSGFSRVFNEPAAQPGWKGLLGKLTDFYNTAAQGALGSIGAAGNVAEQIGVGEDRKANNITFAGRLLSEGLNTFLLPAVQLPAEVVEEGTALYHTTQRLAAQSGMPDIETGSRLIDGLINSGLIGSTYNAIRALKAPLTFEEKKEVFGEELQAARMGWTNEWELGRNVVAATLQLDNFVKPTMREEFLRRLRAGENPELLAMELSNPLIEALGSSVFDPLNFVGWATKGLKISKLEDVISVTTKAASPEIMGVLGKAQDVVSNSRAGELISELAKADDAVAAAAANPLADLARLDAEQVMKSAGAVDAMKDDHWLFSLTASAKRDRVMHQQGTLVNWMANTYGPQETAAVLSDLVKAGSADPAERYRAIAALLRRENPQALFSETAYQMRAVLKEVMTDTFLDDLAKASSSPADFADFFDAKLETALGKIIPDVGDGAKAAALVADPTRIASDADRRLAAWYNSLPRSVKSVARYNQAMQKNLYRPINEAFAAVYMGVNPGFAFRNANNNTFQVLIDYGPRAALDNFVVSLKNLFKPGDYTAGFAQKTQRWLGGEALPARWNTGFAGVQAAEGVEGTLPFLARSQAIEMGGGHVIISKSVDRTMRRMLKPGRALPSVAELVAEGVNPRDADLLNRLVMRNYGDVTKALKDWDEAVKIGRFDAMLDLEALLKTDDVKVLREFGAFDDLADTVRTTKQSGGSMDDALKALDDLEAAFTEKAAQVADDLPPIVPEQMPEAMETLADLDSLPDMHDEVKALLQARMNANTATFRAYEDVLDKVIGLPTLSPEQREMVKKVKDFWRQATDLARSQNKDAVETAWKWSNNIKRYVRKNGKFGTWAKRLGIPLQDGATERSFWMNLAKSMGFPGSEDDIARRILEHPDVVAGNKTIRQQLLDEWWNVEFRETRTQYWKAARDGVAASIDDLVGKLGLKADDLPDWARAQENRGLAAQLDDATNWNSVPHPYVPGQPPTLPRVVHESINPIKDAIRRAREAIKANWNKSSPVNTRQRKVLSGWAAKAREGVAKARLAASAIADEERNFTLLNYGGKTYFDHVLSYVWPYQFWYRGTYGNWMNRLAYNPSLIGHYARYKKALATIHADQPEWWRYNINTNELLGLDAENPIYFNLEAMFNPLNGLTGTDFNDPNRRVDWWTRTLDTLGKFGPSVWTPVQLATAVSLWARGEKDAAARWGGRLLPQTGALKAITANLGIGPAGGLDLDPSVYFFSGGTMLDPYEENRVARALGALVQTGEITEAQALDAAREHAGPAWDMARQQATLDRTNQTLGSFLFGISAKLRTPEDQQIDRMYQENRLLWNMQPDMTPEEFRQAMDQLAAKYPFMNSVLISRKGGVDRDRSYAYNVLSRIPPGAKNDIAQLAGITPEMLQKFYADKGDIQTWTNTDRSRFMAGMIDIGALLEVPDEATRADWNRARNAYSVMEQQARAMFGSDIWERVDRYYAARGDDYASQQQARAILDADPQVGEALSYKTQTVTFNPDLAGYYGSIETLRSYYKTQMYNAIDEELGTGVYNKWAEYMALKATGGDTKAYWKANPDLARYMEIKDEWQPLVDRSVAEFGLKLPQGMPGQFREDADFSGTRAGVAAGLGPQQMPNLSWREWQTILPDSLQVIMGSGRMTQAGQAEIEFIAQQMGLDPRTLQEMIFSAMRDQ